MRRILIVGAVVLLMEGCGFQLRGSQTLPVERLYLALPVNSPIGAEISRVVRSSTNASVVPNRKDRKSVV